MYSISTPVCTVFYRKVTGGSPSALLVGCHLKLDIYISKSETAMPWGHYGAVENKQTNPKESVGRRPEVQGHMCPDTGLSLTSWRPRVSDSLQGPFPLLWAGGGSR